MLAAQQKLFELFLFIFRNGEHRFGHLGFRIVPEHTGELGGRHGKEIGHRMFVDPEPYSVTQDKFLTRSGLKAASSAANIPPIEWPTTWAEGSPMASRKSL